MFYGKERADIRGGGFSFFQRLQITFEAFTGLFYRS